MPNCKIKVKNLYLEDFFLTSEGEMILVEFNCDNYYVFESGEQAQKMKDIIVEELAIPENEINIYMVE